jgi:hypothetical protein
MIILEKPVYIDTLKKLVQELISIEIHQNTVSNKK